MKGMNPPMMMPRRMMKTTRMMMPMMHRHELMMRRTPNRNLHVMTHHGKMMVGRKGRVL